MAVSRTSLAAFAMVLGGLAGVALVAHDVFFTRLVGFSAGCITGLCVFLVVAFFARMLSRQSAKAATWRSMEWNDLNEFNEDAYRIERIFLDDGKLW